MKENGHLEWVKFSCNDQTGTGGVICAKRNIWEEIPNCYVQPLEEASGGNYHDVPETEARKDPVMFCRQKCQGESRYFDINMSETSTICHCIDNPVPSGGFLNDEDCNVPVCTSDQSPSNNNCHRDDGYIRTHLYRSWKTSCPPIDAEFLADKFAYLWDHHGSWHWSSKATLRCLPGYELPSTLGNGNFNHDSATQEVTCLFDEDEGGKWTHVVACEPVRCKVLPPTVPLDAAITVVKSFDHDTNDQAETVLTYTCSQPGWAFNYPYDESKPSFAFTVNIHEITITCHYSKYWEYDNGIEDETCINNQPDGTCERIALAECVDRSVYCKPLSTPENATKALIVQPNSENEYENGTEVQFTCPQSEHYFDYSIPADLVSFFYSTNINTITLSCNDFKFWTVTGVTDNGETCANKKSDNDELWCEDVTIPKCVDRTILCTPPPMPNRAKITPSMEPIPTRYEYKTKINYQCPDRYYFDYPVPDDMISFHYTENIDEIEISCTQDGNWEVKGGIADLTCSDPIEVDSTDNSTTLFRCQSPTIPDCEDRTVYCTFPPENILGGSITTNPNPSQFYKKTDECRWTKWFNTGKGSKGDKESIENIAALFTWQVCPHPKDINARIVGTQETVAKSGGQQKYKVDVIDGFVCNDDDQSGNKCFDYEVQLCCPYAPEQNTAISMECFEENWYLDFKNEPFISSISATCTKNSMWLTQDSEKIFCSDGSQECAMPIFPDCQDRTILCLDELPIPKGLQQVNITSNETFSGTSFGAAYEYSCEEEGFVINTTSYPEALIISCEEPEGYTSDWYYEIWKHGVWKNKVRKLWLI